MEIIEEKKSQRWVEFYKENSVTLLPTMEIFFILYGLIWREYNVHIQRCVKVHRCLLWVTVVLFCSLQTVKANNYSEEKYLNRQYWIIIYIITHFTFEITWYCSCKQAWIIRRQFQERLTIFLWLLRRNGLVTSKRQKLINWRGECDLWNLQNLTTCTD